MIAGLVIIGFFVVSIAGLAVLGTKVRNPAELDRAFDDRLAILANEVLGFQRAVFAAWLPATRQMAAQMTVIGDAFAALTPMMRSAAERFAEVARMVENAEWDAAVERRAAELEGRPGGTPGL